MLTTNTVIKLKESRNRESTISALEACIMEGEPVYALHTATDKELMIEQNRILYKYLGDAFNLQEVSDLIRIIYYKEASEKVVCAMANQIMWNLSRLTPLADPKLVDLTSPNFLVIGELVREVNQMLSKFANKLGLLSNWVEEPEIAIRGYEQMAKVYIDKKRLLLSQVIYGGK